MPDKRPHVPADAPPLKMPQVFGWQHLLFLSVFLAISVPLLVLAARKLKDEKKQDLTVKIMGGILLASVIISRIGYAVSKDNLLFVLPDSFCSLMSPIFGICAIFCKRDHIVFHYLCYTAILGGLANLAYPYYVTWLVHFSHPSTLFGMIHHAVAVDLAILMIITGHFKPSSKKFYAFPLGIVFNICYGTFLIDALGVKNLGEKGFETAMNIFTPLVPGVFLFSWYLAFPVIAAALYGVVRLYEYLLNRYRSKKEFPVSDSADSAEVKNHG